MRLLRSPPPSAAIQSKMRRRTGPSGSLLSRTPIPPPGRFAPSTQLPLEELRELLTQDSSTPDGVSGRSPSVGLTTSLPPERLMILHLNNGQRRVLY